MAHDLNCVFGGLHEVQHSLGNAGDDENSGGGFGASQRAHENSGGGFGASQCAHKNSGVGFGESQCAHDSSLCVDVLRVYQSSSIRYSSTVQFPVH
jgi:hypothetical protein